MEAACSLCSPDGLKGCFACCPPIRPPGYEHIQYRTVIQRVLRENTRDFPGRREDIAPITGFSCWALGYLDDGFNRIGCLLHPGRNQGADLRDRTGFGGKCRRESCLEARIFDGLAPSVQRFWLRLADGLDSFSYSSRSVNPLFFMIGWGEEILSVVAREEAGRVLSRESLAKAYPFFETSLNPRANAYLLRQVVRRNGPACLREDAFREGFERFAQALGQEIGYEVTGGCGSPFTHRLNLDRSFLDYLRLSLGLKRVEAALARKLKGRVDRAEEEFGRRWNRRS